MKHVNGQLLLKALQDAKALGGLRLGTIFLDRDGEESNAIIGALELDFLMNKGTKLLITDAGRAALTELEKVKW